MRVRFQSKDLARDCEGPKSRTRRWGEVRGKLVGRRLDELQAAPTLATLKTLPQLRCHELKNNRSGQLSVDLGQPYRMIFTVDHAPRPTRGDGGLDWARVTAVVIHGVEDTHE
ncbi:MAG: killer suppression protein [Deltaproteobacteria bacterium]|nr:killer suppression protein [Deltaproteobacteria bacterium]